MSEQDVLRTGDEIDEAVAIIQKNIESAEAMLKSGQYNFANLPERLHNREDAEKYLNGLRMAHMDITTKEASWRGEAWAYSLALDAVKRKQETT